MDADTWNKIVESLEAAIGGPTPIVARSRVIPVGPPMKITDVRERCAICGFEQPVGDMTMTDAETWECDDVRSCATRLERADSETPMIELKKFGYRVHVPRELLLDAGAVEPTPAERAEYERRAAEHTAKLDAARQHLASLTDPLTRLMLDLHSEDERGECEGDDFDGYEAERPSWPCRTIEAVAEHHGIALP